MPKVSLDMPAEILQDIRNHVGDDKNLLVLQTQLEQA